MTTNATIEQTYAVAHESAVLVDHDRRGMMALTGETRLELINRMSTQAVAELRSGEGAATVLTTNIGRIIDRIIVYATSATAYVLTGDDHAEALARYFLRNIFFNDDAQVRDISAETVVFGIYGPGATEVVARAAQLPTIDLPLHHWRSIEIGGATAYAHRADPIAGGGCFVTANATDRPAVWAGLAAEALSIDEPAYEYLRIEAGVPRFRHELTLDYIPLEAGLWDDVSFRKGCYTGQEIIARMESRGKLAKRLVRLRASEPVEAGMAVSAGGRVVGTITSAASGPEGALALGYVKSSTLAERAALDAGGITLAVVES